MLERMVAEIRDLLSVGLPDVSFVTDFSKEKKENPLKRITVSVGLNSAEFYEVALGDFLGCDTDLQQGERYGKLLKAEIGFKICVPISLDGVDSYDVFSRIADKVYFGGGNRWSVESVFCRGLSYDRVTSAKVLEAGVVVSICAEREGA